MVYRIYVEKKDEFAGYAKSLLREFRELFNIEGLTNIRVVNRYDVQGIDEETFKRSINGIFSEPAVDVTCFDLDSCAAYSFAIEYLPGQFDQRADSAAQCIQIMSQADKPIVKSAKVVLLYGELSNDDIATIKKYLINPVESREASMELPDSLEMDYDCPSSVEIVDGFIDMNKEQLYKFISNNGLAMDIDDLEFVQNYFSDIERDPTITEIKVIDTYWSDHCRHTTFHTIIDKATFQDEILQNAMNEYLALREELNIKKPICLMDLATIATKYLKKNGYLDMLDESQEINACTVKIDIQVEGKPEKWLLLFKNETHNHPTEIEPFGGAATCIGGAIRDPLSGRSYVYGAMRISGAGDPTVPIKDTLKGKLPQRKIVQTAADGYSSYGNQIGLATGIVDEIYHPGYIAKRMEVGAVIAAAPQENVIRQVPSAGDVIILLGGATGRDGIGGATGSSKAHTSTSVEECGAEVQKGNAPVERKLQRLFRNKEASTLIKRCNDFGAGGVCVAIGEIADGLIIDLDNVPKKYEGLDGTELAISESQERMAVCVEEKDVSKFLDLAYKENLNAVPVAVVTEQPILVIKWNGKKIVDISRDFLDTNGADKHIDIETNKIELPKKDFGSSFTENFKKLAQDLNVCSKQGLSEQFDSTIGSSTVLMPFGGKYQLTPIQAMVHKISIQDKHSDDCSLMSWAYNPYISEVSPYHGAYLAVIESVCKLIASGCSFDQIYLSFQEYFERLNNDKNSWGKPLSALLGAFKAQMDLKIAAIGGKDSMSGTFEDIHVPPTLISFAVSVDKSQNIISPEFKKAGSKVYVLCPKVDENGLPVASSLLENFTKITKLMRDKKILSCWSVGYGGIAEAVMKMSFGNRLGFDFITQNLDDLFEYKYGAFVFESNCDIDNLALLGTVTENFDFNFNQQAVSGDEILDVYQNKLESIYPQNANHTEKSIENISFTCNKWNVSPIKVAKPKVLIPAFPGTNCEYDTSKIMTDAGADSKIFVINNLNQESLKQSIQDFAKEISSSQIIFLPGGFSGGDEPDGSAKFITSFFRNEEIKDAVSDLLDNRSGLMGGICNGFQALIKLGLVPYGKITECNAESPTLTFNSINKHQSRIVRTRIASNMSPWLSNLQVGDIISVAISHGEGRLIASEECLSTMLKNGQIATQYVDLDGNATSNIKYNPNNSVLAIEGITSPDGRIFGKMGHAERIDSNLYKNIHGKFDYKMFESAVSFFK